MLWPVTFLSEKFTTYPNESFFKISLGYFITDVKAPLWTRMLHCYLYFIFTDFLAQNKWHFLDDVAGNLRWWIFHVFNPDFGNILYYSYYFSVKKGNSFRDIVLRKTHFLTGIRNSFAIVTNDYYSKIMYPLNKFWREQRYYKKEGNLYNASKSLYSILFIITPSMFCKLWVLKNVTIAVKLFVIICKLFSLNK